jgi:hypothetical protein
MTVSPVTIDVSAELGALPQETFTDAAVIGTATSSPPGAAFGEVNRYQSASEVQDDYGDGSDVHTASQNVAEMGADAWYVIVLEETEVADETVDDGSTVANTPILGNAGVTADTRDVVYVADDPVTTPDAGEVAINTATGEISTGDGTSATLTYSHVDWSGLDELAVQGINRAHLADTRAGLEHIGDYDAFVGWASAAQVGVILPLKNPQTYADDQAAMEAAHEIAGYVPAGNVLPVAAKAGGDIGAHKLGQLAVNDPWFDPYFDNDGYPYSIDSIKGSLIGDPGTTGTFVGGDADGSGPVNVVISVSGVNVLWRSVSTAGAASDYQFFDQQMTEYFSVSVIENALTSLQLQEDRIPFTGIGQSMIEGSIVGALDEYVGGPDDPFADATVNVPDPEDLGDTDKSNRNWTGITLEYQLSGSAQTFEVDLTLTL